MNEWTFLAIFAVVALIGGSLKACSDAGLQRDCIQVLGNWDGSKCIIASPLKVGAGE